MADRGAARALSFAAHIPCGFQSRTSRTIARERPLLRWRAPVTSDLPLRPAHASGAMIGRLAYIALFSAAVPALLVAWAIRLDQILTLPAYGSIEVGSVLVMAGLALMAEATRELWLRGRGLPASPYPPKRLVTSGLYA